MILTNPFAVIDRAENDPDDLWRAEGNRTWAKYVTVDDVSMHFIEPRNLSAVEDTTPPLITEVTNGKKKYPTILWYHCYNTSGQFCNRHPAGLLVCITSEEKSKTILDRWLDGKLACPVYLQEGQRLECPAYMGLIANNLVGLDLKTLSYLCRVTHAVYYHMLGNLQHKQNQWMIFGKDSCRSKTLLEMSQKFEHGFIANDLYIDMFLRVLGLNRLDFEDQILDQDLFKEILRRLEQDSIERKNIKEMGIITAADIAKQREQAKQSGNSDVTGLRGPLLWV